MGLQARSLCAAGGLSIPVPSLGIPHPGGAHRKQAPGMAKYLEKLGADGAAGRSSSFHRSDSRPRTHHCLRPETDVGPQTGFGCGATVREVSRYGLRRVADHYTVGPDFARFLLSLSCAWSRARLRLFSESLARGWIRMCQAEARLWTSPRGFVACLAEAWSRCECLH